MQILKFFDYVIHLCKGLWEGLSIYQIVGAIFILLVCTLLFIILHPKKDKRLKTEKPKKQKKAEKVKPLTDAQAKWDPFLIAKNVENKIADPRKYGRIQRRSNFEKTVNLLSRATN